jgi:hypothetical protein
MLTEGMQSELKAISPQSITKNITHLNSEHAIWNAHSYDGFHVLSSGSTREHAVFNGTRMYRFPGTRGVEAAGNGAAVSVAMIRHKMAMAALDRRANILATAQAVRDGIKAMWQGGSWCSGQ